MPDIDKLSIEITAKVKSDQEKLNKLNDSLSRLQSITEKSFGNLDAIINKLNNLTSLDNLKNASKRINALANSLIKLKSINLSGFSNKMNAFVRGLQPLEAISTETITQISAIGASINKFANAMLKLDMIDVSVAERKILGITNAIKPLTNEMIRGGTVAKSYAIIISNLGTSINNTEKKAKRSGASFARMVGSFYLIRRTLGFLSDMVIETAKWTENLNLFANSFGEQKWKEVLDWTQDIAENFGFASNELVKFTGLFKQLSTSLGIANDTGTELSQTLTQLALDFSSFYNVNLERSFATFQSAIFGGQTKGARLLFGVEVAYQSLDQILKTNEGLKELGVTSKQLTQDQKALLRTIAFLTSGRNSFGDMAKTINSTMNQIRIFEGAISNLKLALGDMLLAEPFRKMLTYVNGTIIGITEIIRAFVGFNNDVSLSSPIGQLEEINDEIDKIKGGLLSFDKFESLTNKDSDAIANLEVTKALTAELKKQTDLYKQMQKQMKNVKNEAVEIGKKIKDWFVIDTKKKDKNGNPIYEWTESAKNLAKVIKGIFTLGIFVKLVKIVGAIGHTIAGVRNLVISLRGLEAFLPIILMLKSKILIISAFVTLLGVMYSKNENFRESVKRLFGTLSRFMSTVLKPLINMFTTIVKILDPFITIIANVFSMVLERINERLEKMQKILQPICDFLTLMFEIVDKFVDFANNKVTNMFTNLGNSIRSFGEKIKGIGGKVWDKIKSFFSNSWKKTGEWFRNLFQFRADGGTFDLRGGNAVGVVNESGNELLYSNESKQIEVANQKSLEDSFLNALMRYSNINNGKSKIEVVINDKSSFGDFTRKVTRPIIEEGQRIGML